MLSSKIIIALIAFITISSALPLGTNNTVAPGFGGFLSPNLTNQIVPMTTGVVDFDDLKDILTKTGVETERIEVFVPLSDSPIIVIGL